MATRKSKLKKPIVMAVAISGDLQFEVHVPENSIASFKKDLARRELALNIWVDHAGQVSFLDVYADQIADGKLEFSLNGKTCSVAAAGLIKKEFDPDYEAELIKAVTDGGKVVVSIASVVDSNATSYYVDGDEDKVIEIGTFTVIRDD